MASLNPCSNGRYSQRIMEKKNVIESLSLNPCSNGRYSQSVVSDSQKMEVATS